MNKPPEFDLDKAHRYFSAECFNRTWDNINKPVRTPEDERAMLASTLASLWHWSRRPDATQENYSVGYWQVARVFTLIGQADLARRYGQLCLQAGLEPGVPPYCRGYAYEALARAEKLAGNAKKVKEYLELAREVSAIMTDPDDKKQLLADLATIG